jgi:hypothetical protein
MLRGVLRGHLFKRQHWVQLDEVWRRSNLAMVAIEEFYQSDIAYPGWVVPACIFDQSLSPSI